MKHLELTDELQEKACIYAAGAMPEDERREYVRHLDEDECAICRREVHELESTASLLGLGLPPQAPSTAVKVRLMEQAERVADAPARRPRRPWWFTLATDLVALAALILVVVIARDNSRLRELTDSLNTRVVELESQITQQGLKLAALTSSDVRVVDLAGQGATPRAGARIFWDQPARKWHVYVHGLPPAPSGRTYQLWFVPKGGKPVSADVFNTAADGSSQAEIPVPDNIGVLAAAAVTTEPAGGLPQPSGPYALLAQLE